MIPDKITFEEDYDGKPTLLIRIKDEKRIGHHISPELSDLLKRARARNGIAIRMLYKVLLEIYPQNLAYKIFNEVNMNEGDGKILEVSIYHDEDNNTVVKAHHLIPL